MSDKKIKDTPPIKNTGAKLPEGVLLENLKNNFDICTVQYRKAFKRAKVLDATEKGYLWTAIEAKFPKYQILPHTNHVRYVKNNLLASIYTVGKAARVAPTSEADKEIVEHINTFLEHFWSIGNVGYYQMQAGERAALLNIGITQVGWDGSIVSGDGDTFYKGAPVYKNINPLKFMRDPYATDLDHAGYCITWDQYHKSVILKNPNYKKEFETFLKTHNNGMNTTVPEVPTDRVSGANSISNKDYYRVIVHWVRVANKIHEIHTIDNTYVLFVKEDIQPSVFPFALCYCNIPGEDLIGTSEPAAIFANSLADNMLKSIILTAEYKNQRPPRFVNTQSGLNVKAFAKHGNDADRVFPVNGDASRAVHYQSYPNVSAAAFSILNTLSNDMQMVTGVDGHYTGRDTGSILTTGGIENMLDQASLIDAPKIMLYEEYAKRLTNLTLANFVIHGTERTYLVKDPETSKYSTQKIDFPQIDNHTIFNYEINISSQLPKTKQQVAQQATMLMEKQMQYRSAGLDVDLITPEEWLMFQDFPNREYMQRRMGIQRLSNEVEDVTETIFGFAELTKNGMEPQDAVNAMAQYKINKRNPQEDAPLMPGVAEAPLV